MRKLFPDRTVQNFKRDIFAYLDTNPRATVSEVQWMFKDVKKEVVRQYHYQWRQLKKTVAYPEIKEDIILIFEILRKKVKKTSRFSIEEEEASVRLQQYAEYDKWIMREKGIRVM